MINLFMPQYIIIHKYNANSKVPFKIFSYSVDLLNAIAISASAALWRARAACLVATLPERYFRCSQHELNASSSPSIRKAINRPK